MQVRLVNPNKKKKKTVFLGFSSLLEYHGSCGIIYVILPYQILTLLFYYIILQYPVY